MTSLPESIREAWENREGPAILTTVDSSGLPNSIYVTCVSSFEDKLVVADNYFDKTRKNLLKSPKASMLFMTGEGKAYQVKGSLEYHKEGEIFDHMKTWNPTKHPGHAAVAMKIEEIYSGAEKLFEA